MHVTGDRIGDALLKYPALRAFRAACPRTRITWVTGLRPSVFAGRLAPLAQGLIDEIHSATGLGQHLFAPLPTFLAPHYDTVLASEAKLRTTLVLRRIACRRFLSPTWNFFFSHARPDGDFADATGYQRFTLLLSLAAGVTLTPRAAIDVPPELGAMAAALLPDGPCYVGLCPGAGGARKRWPPERFIELARRQAARGRVPVFFLGPEEADLRARFAMVVPQARFAEEEAAARGAGGVLASIALAGRLTLGVSNDSGGGHLLAAGGRPMLKLYGHTSAHKFRSPYGPQHALEAATFGGETVAAIPVDAVDDAVESMLRHEAASSSRRSNRTPA